MRRNPLFTPILGALALSWASQAPAQSADTFPNHAVTIIANVAAGGPTDIEARLHAKKMADFLGQPFVLDFKPGAQGNIGANFVAKSKPDGYTLLVSSSSFSVLPAFMSQPFDVEKDFAPVSLVSQRTSIMLGSPNFPARTIPEYVAYAKANPGKINFGWVGPSVVAGAWLHSITGIQVTYVPYKGTGPVMNDLVAGRLDVASSALTLAMPLIKAGKVRPIAVLDERRTPLFPDLPTVKEQGIPDFAYRTWLGYLAPAATPPAIVAKLSQNLVRAVKSPEVASVLEPDGNRPVGTTPEEFRQLLAEELARWRRIAKETGFKLEDQ